jgi:hypothetical protein
LLLRQCGKTGAAAGRGKKLGVLEFGNNPGTPPFFGKGERMPAEPLKLDTLRGSGTPLMAKMALAKLSEDLVASPADRAEFIKNPAGFIRAQFGYEPNQTEQSYFSALAQMYDDGNCCQGCGCRPQ